MQISVTRAFYLGGNVQVVGSQIEVGESLGRELVAMNKAVIAEVIAPVAQHETEKPKRTKRNKP